MERNQKGHSLVELLMTCAIIGIVVTMSAAVFDQTSRRISLAAATSELRSVFHQVRATAVTRNMNVGIKFVQADDMWRYSVYEDRDGDGVRNDDIARGVDVQLMPSRAFLHRPARIGIPSGDVRDPLSGGVLSSRAAVRFNSSTLCSFSKQGEATNGSVVLTDGKHATIVQVKGGSALIAVWRWNGDTWRRGV